ncbi:hypothetical protein KUTeg_015078 [Tegillarca granosa]|uniref:EF-hand domain-containing protein n=1 Tax=Tegillarca granosa TaxID=220873 RepID=A0ABQ9EP23_TEGGR|nr:hypothetical protein KUTeg_015078 [Tegillarca granosa]
MKITVLLLMSLIALATFSSVNAWRRRRFRIRFRRILKPLCPLACSQVCRTACAGCTPVCGPVCSRVCRGKREANKVFEDGTFLKPMPCHFSTYDSNGDKVISPAELGSLTNESGEEDDINELFAVMDVDGDGGVNEEEFEAAPLIKDCGGQGAETDTEGRDLEADIDNDEEE